LKGGQEDKRWERYAGEVLEPGFLDNPGVFQLAQIDVILTAWAEGWVVVWSYNKGGLKVRSNFAGHGEGGGGAEGR